MYNSGMPPWSRIITPLMVFLVALASAWGFVVLARKAPSGQFRDFDNRVITAFRVPGSLDDPQGPPWIEHLARDVTALGSTWVVLLATAMAIGFLLAMGRRDRAIWILLAISSGMGAFSLLKHFLGRPRPELVSNLVHAESPSFPSGHAMMATMTYLTLALLVARGPVAPGVRTFALCAAILLALLIGLTRIYLGVHWPTDVAAGWAAGLAWALSWLLLEWLYGSLRRNRQKELQGPA